MRGLVGIVGVVCLCALGFAAATVSAAHSAPAASCTAAQQSAAQAALAKYQSSAAAKRKAYFAKHKTAGLRAAYDKRQKATLARLNAGAACTVATPTTTSGGGTAAAGEPCSPTLDAAGNATNSVGPLRNAGVKGLGTLKAVMLFVDFPDAAATETAQSVYDLLGPGAQSYYSSQSFGRLSLQITPVLKWYRLSKNSTDYGMSRTTISFDHQLAYMQEAVNLANADVDFSQYQLVYVVATRNASAMDFSPAFDPNRDAQGTFALKADGTNIFGGATFGKDIYSNARWGWHTLAHETGHVFGMPDYYDIPGFDSNDYQHQFHYAGGWTVMSWSEPAAEFFAWDKYREGWIDPAQIRCQDIPGSITETVTPDETSGGIKLLVSKTGPSTAVAVEVRSLAGGDAQMCSAGVLVYALDARNQSGQGPLQIETPHPGDPTDSTKVGRCAILWDAPLRVDDSWENDSVKVEVLASNPDGSFSVRLTRK